MMNITGVIMAGGKSSRMGSDKGLLVFKDKPLVQYAIDLLKPFCSELLISTANEAYAQFGIPLVKDDIPDCGPMGGIYSALKASKNNGIVVLACDMPFVTATTIQSLFEKVEAFDCIVPSVNGKLEPLCAIYSKSLIVKIEENISKGELAMNRLIKGSKHLIVEFENAIPDFQNLNTLDELEIH